MKVATRASLVLVGTCVLWAFSFPFMKALEQVGRLAEPEASSVFFAALCVALRFSLAALLLGLWIGPRLTGLTRLEFEQGAGLGFFGGIGLVLQMDGMAYTLASTSAFLTQAYCVLIPLWIALRYRSVPPPSVLAACAAAIAGAAILAGVDGRGLRLGRGEWETLAGSVLFAGQILWLERPRFHGNHVGRATWLMFALMAATAGPLALATAPRPAAVLHAYASPTALVLLVLLTVLCTRATFPLANKWQPRIPATQAGLLYCTEPVFASAAALWVPGVVSTAAGIAYANERLTWNLAGGGALVIAANIALQLRPPPRPTPDGSRPIHRDPP